MPISDKRWLQLQGLLLLLISLASISYRQVHLDYLSLLWLGWLQMICSEWNLIRSDSIWHQLSLRGESIKLWIIFIIIAEKVEFCRLFSEILKSRDQLLGPNDCISHLTKVFKFICSLSIPHGGDNLQIFSALILRRIRFFGTMGQSIVKFAGALISLYCPDILLGQNYTILIRLNGPFSKSNFREVDSLPFCGCNGRYIKSIDLFDVLSSFLSFATQIYPSWHSRIEARSADIYLSIFGNIDFETSYQPLYKFLNPLYCTDSYIRTLFFD